MPVRTAALLGASLMLVGALAPVATAGSMCFGRTPTIAGGGDDETLEGSRGDDVIVGGSGNDTILGRGGNDRICSGAGEDYVDAGTGADHVLAGPSDDEIKGGPGPDFIDGDRQHDVLHGNSGNDRIHTGRPGEGDEYAYGGLGRDVIVASRDDAFVFIFGNKGDDRLVGVDETDFLDGGPGDDTIEGGIASFASSTAAVRASATAGTAIGDGSDRLRGVVGLAGSRAGDALVGGAASETIIGLAGDDTISGGPGSDALGGGRGSDSVTGGAGADTLRELGDVCGLPGGCGIDEADDTYDGGRGIDLLDYGGFTSTGVRVDLSTDTSTGAGTDTLAALENVSGTQLSDILIGNGGPNRLSAGAGGGDDHLEGRAGDDVLHDTFNELGSPGEEDDVFDGGPGNDEVTAALGDDRITGGDGADRLFGGPGDDVIYGDGGDDTLDGHEGADQLDGGPGSDECTSGETTTSCET